MSTNEDSSTWRLATPNGIPYKLLDSSGNFTEEGAIATDTILIRADQLLAFAAECFPLSIVQGGVIFYPRPFTYPGLPTLQVKNLRWERDVDGLPIDPLGSAVSLYDAEAYARTYKDHIRLTVEYGVDVENDTEKDVSDPFTFLEISTDSGGTFLSSPSRGVDAEWVEVEADPDANPVVVEVREDVKEIDAPFTLIETETEWTVVWRQLPWQWFDDVLINRIRSMEGKVNDTPMTVFHNAPVNTILFLGFSKTDQYTWREGFPGRSPVDVEFKFIERGFQGPGALIQEADPDANPPVEEQVETILVTHQHVYRPSKGYRRMLIEGKSLYIQTNLNNMFSFNQP